MLINEDFERIFFNGIVGVMRGFIVAKKAESLNKTIGLLRRIVILTLTKRSFILLNPAFFL